MKTTILKAICVIAILFTSMMMYAQSNLLTVTGKVIDADDKDPLVGVAVQIKGTNTGTVTDYDGIFSIQVEKGKTLVFSYIGYIKQEVKVSKESINVSLKPDNKTLDEVVVVGYGVQKLSVADYELSKRPAGVNSNSSAGYYISTPATAPAYSYDSERNEEYSSFAENRFKDAKSDPLSTFSLDVDVASYSNVRRMINQGQKPAKDAVRVEQFINYFSYDYPNPTGKHPINILTETQACPWNKDNLLVRIGVKAKEVPSENIPASNFVFLIDVSGSMESPNRLPLVKSSLKLLTNNLREKDRVSIVVYAGAAGERLPSTSGADKQKIFEALDALSAGGSTAGGAGIELAYKVAQKNFIKGGNNRIILCTDGDFNVGVSSEKGLENLIEEKRQTGVYLTILGYGMGNYKDSKLQILSQKGNGNHAYIDNLQEANRVLVQEFGSSMYAVAKDVKMQVEFNPAYVSAYRLVGYESRLLNKEDFNDDTKDAGELGAGHTVTAFYEIIPVGVKNSYGGVDDLKYQKTSTSESTQGVKNNEMMTVKLRYKPLNSENSIKMETPVLISDKNKTPSVDFTFASAVAMFGQLLRNSDFKGTSTYDDVISLARKGFGEDKQGYRHEFVRLAEAMKQLDK
ncbi:MAG: von Willebrand factor type A domain-containing protein [Dysgonamonadaceae bacterium]|jgi:Ca-activated chloride channel family protein|nr:von Willebrand factor type A domain-containing protein [Dysgonamonadaceae bacterium]